MPRLSDIRRIIVEDFAKEDQPVAEKISASYNDFADDVLQLVNGNIDFENLTRRKVTIDISFDAAGNPVGVPTINTDLGFVSMLHIGKIVNLNNSVARFSATPYLEWNHLGNGVVRIIYGIGFQAGVRYRFTLELIQ